MNIADQNSRRPVELTVQTLAVTIRAIEIDPIVAQLRKANENFDVLGEPNKEDRATVIGRLREVPKAAARETSLEIVGESYFRLNSTSRFYPTLIFHFKEAGIESLGKRTQIKVRWTAFKLEDTFDVSHRKSLEEKLRGFLFNRLTYWSGPLRANFVSLTPARWKTIVYVKEEQDGIEVLSKVLNVLEEPFAKEHLSFTTGRKIVPATKVVAPLGLLRQPEWTRVCLMELNKVVLLVNGAEKPMEVFRFQEE